MTIAQKIESAVAACKSGVKNYTFTFYHMEPEELNRREEGTQDEDSQVKFPFVFLEFPLVGQDEIVFNQVKTTYAVRLYFANKSTLSNNLKERAAEIAAMELAKNEFLISIASDSDVEIVNRPQLTQVQEAIDFTFDTDGVYYNLQLKLDTTPPC